MRDEILSGRVRIDARFVESGRVTEVSTAPAAPDNMATALAEVTEALAKEARRFESVVAELRPVALRGNLNQRMNLARQIDDVSERARGLRALEAQARQAEWDYFRSCIRFDVTDASARAALRRAFEGLLAEDRRLAPSRVAGISDWQANALPGTYGAAIPDDETGRHWITLNLQTLARVSEYERVRACAHELIHAIRGHRSRDAAVKEIHEAETRALVDLWFPSQ